MTIEEFTKKYSDSLSARFPNESFKIVDDRTIKSKSQENEFIISVDNAYRDYQAEPDSLQEVFARYLSLSSELFTPIEKINIDKIVPIIKSIEFLDGIESMTVNNDGKTVEAIYEKYNEQLVIFFAEDKKSSIRYLTHDDIKSLSLNKDSLRAIAVRNLDKLLTNIQAKGGDGLFMITAGGDYEASLILLNNVITKESFSVNGDFVIAIPTRDLLLITGSNDKSGISKIKDVAKEAYNTGSYQVSEHLYKWDGKMFKKFQ